MTVAMLRKLDREVVITFNDLQQCLLSVNNRHLLKLPLHSLTKKDTPYKLEWLRIAQITLQNIRHTHWHRLHIGRQQLEGMQRNMRIWMQCSHAARSP